MAQAYLDMFGEMTEKDFFSCVKDFDLSLFDEPFNEDTSTTCTVVTVPSSTPTLVALLNAPVKTVSVSTMSSLSSPRVSNIIEGNTVFPRVIEETPRLASALKRANTAVSNVSRSKKEKLQKRLANKDSKIEEIREKILEKEDELLQLKEELLKEMKTRRRGKSWCIVEAGHGLHRRFLFGGSLEDHVPQECTYFSEFVEVYDVYAQWINHGQYVYLKLASIQAKTLRHEQLNTEEQAYAPLLTKLSANKSSEFGQTYDNLAGIQEYGHEFCVAILQFGIVQVLMKHESELCQQFLTIDSVNAASVCTPPTPKPVLISCKQCNDSTCSGDNTPVTCDVGQICLISVQDSIGDRKVHRGCVDSDTCIQEQKANGGYLNYCMHVNDGPLGFPATCNFCCNKNNCNSGVSLVPDRNSLFIADLSS